MCRNYNTIKVILSYTLISAVISAGEPFNLDQFVHRYMVIHKSKMESSPVVWQEIKEGHLRNKAILYSDLVLDSLQAGSPALDIAVRHFQMLTDMRWDVYDSGDYNMVIKSKPPHNANYNYFSTKLE